MLESREILNDGYMSSVVKELNVAVPVEIKRYSVEYYFHVENVVAQNFR